MTIFKALSAEDRVSTKTLLHEAIPITGTILSGTYGTFPNERNIQNFTHGMFQSVYDYPYLSSSANHIFDISIGTSADGHVTTVQTTKDNIYNQMAQVLVGYDKDGNIRKFDEDGDLTGGGTIDDAIFLSFSRLLVKDEIKKGSFQLELGVNLPFDQASTFGKRIKLTDASGSNGYLVNSPAGEYGVLYAETTHDGDSTLSDSMIDGEIIAAGAVTSPKPSVGLLFYQAGVAVISDKVFKRNATATIRATNGPAENDTIEIFAADGTSVTFTTKTSPGVTLSLIEVVLTML